MHTCMALTISLSQQYGLAAARVEWVYEGDVPPPTQNTEYGDIPSDLANESLHAVNLAE